MLQVSFLFLSSYVEQDVCPLAVQDIFLVVSTHHLVIAMIPVAPNFHICHVVALVKRTSVIRCRKQIVQDLRTRIIVVDCVAFANTNFGP